MFKIPGLDTYFDGVKAQGCNSVPDIISLCLAGGMSAGVGGPQYEKPAATPYATTRSSFSTS